MHGRRTAIAARRGPLELVPGILATRHSIEADDLLKSGRSLGTFYRSVGGLLPERHRLCLQHRLPSPAAAEPAGGDGANAMVVHRSTDGGLTWSNPIELIRDIDPRFFNDKNTITADPTNSSYVYAVWDRLKGPNGEIINPENVVGLGYHGPAYLTRTTDGGATWEPAAVAIYHRVPTTRPSAVRWWSCRQRHRARLLQRDPELRRTATAAASSTSTSRSCHPRTRARRGSRGAGRTGCRSSQSLPCSAGLHRRVPRRTPTSPCAPAISCSTWESTHAWAPARSTPSGRTRASVVSRSTRSRCRARPMVGRPGQRRSR